MGLLDQMLGPVGLPQQPTQQKGGAPIMQPPTWVNDSLAPGGPAPAPMPGMVNTANNMQANVQQAAGQQGVPSTDMTQASQAPGYWENRIQQALAGQPQMMQSQKPGRIW